MFENENTHPARGINKSLTMLVIFLKKRIKQQKNAGLVAVALANPPARPGSKAQQCCTVQSGARGQPRPESDLVLVLQSPSLYFKNFEHVYIYHFLFNC
jgi:hypothetical protein